MENQVANLLELRYQTEKEFLQKFVKEFSLEESKKLAFEAKAFSFWILMISIPHGTKEFFDLLHNTYFSNSNFTNEQKDRVYLELTKRYSLYTDAYNYFLKHKGTSSLGDTIVSVIKNNFTDFNSYEDLINKILAFNAPAISAFDSINAMGIFNDLFKINIKLVSEVGKQ